MNKSENINELAAALSKAQGAIRGALKDSDNPFFKSKYADLASVVDAIREAFSSNGIAYVQTVEPSDKNEVRVETILMHSSGQWISCGVLSLPVSKADAQGFGSAITYARRYSLSAAAGVAPEDDDGNAASKAAPKHGQEIKPGVVNGWTIEAQEQFAIYADDIYTIFRDTGKNDKHSEEAEKWRKRMVSDTAENVLPAMAAWVKKLQAALPKKADA